jgi:hypothetical protein
LGGKESGEKKEKEEDEAVRQNRGSEERVDQSQTRGSGRRRLFGCTIELWKKSIGNDNDSLRILKREGSRGQAGQQAREPSVYLWIPVHAPSLYVSFDRKKGDCGWAE